MKLLTITAVLLCCALPATADRCRTCPLCEASRMKMACHWKPERPRPEDLPAKVRCMEGMLLTEVHGQAHIMKDIHAALVNKMRFPGRPLVLNFAGDNGVGKTMVAKLISLATSMYFARDTEGSSRDYGDNLVMINGASYHGMTVADTRQAIVGKVTGHLRKFPQGVVLVDDAQELDPAAIEMLAPLLGRANEFAEAPGVNLDLATVILTSDFGREGRTRGKTLEELRALIDDEMQTVYRYSNVKHLQTFPFLPLGTDAARSLIRASVEGVRCRDPRVRRAVVDDSAVDVLLQRLNEQGAIRHGNGRAVASEVLKAVDNKVGIFAADGQGADVAVDVHLRVAASGDLGLLLTPVDGMTPEVEL
jgi:ATP-dependent Clp protease ATP-binding subunit ClpA